MTEFNVSRVVKLLAGLVLGVFLLSAGCASVVTVPSGSVGVVTRFAATTGGLLSPGGPYFVTPFVSDVELMDTQTHAHTVRAGAASKDLQNVTTDVTVNYALASTGAVRMFNDMRRDYVARILVPSLQEAIKSTTARYNAEELVTLREKVRSEIATTIQERLARHDILIDQVSITDFNFDPEYAKAIEQKQVAQQDALAAENRVRVAKANADSRIATARGEAEAIRISAEAIQSKGGAEYVNLKAIEKWDGTLPQWMGGGAPVPFVNVGGSK